MLFSSKWNKVTINQLIEKYKIQWLKSDQHLIKTGYNRFLILIMVHYCILDLLREQLACPRLIIEMNIHG